MCYLFLTRLNVYVKSDAFTHMARYTVHSFNSSIRSVPDIGRYALARYRYRDWIGKNWIGASLEYMIQNDAEVRAKIA